MKPIKMWAVPWTDIPIEKGEGVFALFGERGSAQDRMIDRPIPVMVTIKVIKPKSKKAKKA